MNVIKANDGDQYDHFGFAVALRTDVAVVGAYGHSGSGAAYVYTLDNPVGNKEGLSWDQTAKFTASDPTYNA